MLRQGLTRLHMLLTPGRMPFHRTLDNNGLGVKTFARSRFRTKLIANHLGRVDARE